MRDGVMLRADVYSPARARRLPVVLIRMPYGKGRHSFMAARGKFWARKGYHCVIRTSAVAGAPAGRGSR